MEVSTHSQQLCLLWASSAFSYWETSMESVPHWCCSLSHHITSPASEQKHTPPPQKYINVVFKAKWYKIKTVIWTFKWKSSISFIIFWTLPEYSTYIYDKTGKCYKQRSWTYDGLVTWQRYHINNHFYTHTNFVEVLGLCGPYTHNHLSGMKLLSLVRGLELLNISM